jgi:multidrug resistance efflux pump
MVKRRRRRGGRLARISVADLNAELQRRRAQAGALQRRHDALAAELDGLRAELEALGSLDGAVPRGPGRPPGRRRARNKTTLPEALVAAMGARTLSVVEAMDAVRAAGYKTKARNFRTVASNALIKSGKFRRVARGRYTVK